MICPKCKTKIPSPPTASEMGRMGNKKTEAVRNAARENGKKGGRPRKPIHFEVTTSAHPMNMTSTVLIGKQRK